MSTNSLTTLPLARLKRVVSIREQIESLELELGQLLGATEEASARNPATDYKKGARAASKEFRWSRYHRANGVQTKSPVASPRLSPAGRAKISAAVAARWERYRAAKAKASRASSRA